MTYIKASRLIKAQKEWKQADPEVAFRRFATLCVIHVLLLFDKRKPFTKGETCAKFVRLRDYFLVNGPRLCRGKQSQKYAPLDDN